MSDEAKHTPGPWNTPGPGATGESQIAPIGWLTHAANATSEERRANARLIAAAPDLLAALQDLLAQCQKWAPTLDCSRARFALAKSRGE